MKRFLLTGDSMVNDAGIVPEVSSPCPVNETVEEVFDSTGKLMCGVYFLDVNMLAYRCLISQESRDIIALAISSIYYLYWELSVF